MLHTNWVNLLCILIRGLRFYYWTNHLLPCKYHCINLYKSCTFWSHNHCVLNIGKKKTFQHVIQNNAELQHLLCEQEGGCPSVATWLSNTDAHRPACWVSKDAALHSGNWPGRAELRHWASRALWVERDFTLLFFTSLGQGPKSTRLLACKCSHCIQTSPLKKREHTQEKVTSVPRPCTSEESVGEYLFPSSKFQVISFSLAGNKDDYFLHEKMALHQVAFLRQKKHCECGQDVLVMALAYFWSIYVIFMEGWKAFSISF